MANELVIRYPTGATLYAHLLDATGQIWNGAGWEAPQNANWLDYDLAMTEAGTTGYYRVSMPAVDAGAYSFTILLQVGGGPVVGDTAIGEGSIQWDGTAEMETNLIPVDVWTYASRTLTPGSATDIVTVNVVYADSTVDTFITKSTA